MEDVCRCRKRVLEFRLCVQLESALTYEFFISVAPPFCVLKVLMRRTMRQIQNVNMDPPKKMLPGSAVHLQTDLAEHNQI